MTKKTHEAFAAMTTGAVCIALRNNMGLNMFQTGLVMTASAVGCLLPDADDPRSWIGRHLPLLCLPLWIVRFVAGCLGKITGSRYVSDFADELGHRKVLHYPFTYFVTFLLVCGCLKLTKYGSGFPAWLSCLFTGILCGIFSHILGDAVFGGVAIGAPFCKRKIKLSPFATGSVAESIAFILFIFSDIVVIKNVFGM